MLIAKATAFSVGQPAVAPAVASPMSVDVVITVPVATPPSAVSVRT